jgi:hypothetical protein
VRTSLILLPSRHALDRRPHACWRSHTRLAQLAQAERAIPRRQHLDPGDLHDSNSGAVIFSMPPRSGSSVCASVELMSSSSVPFDGSGVGVGLHVGSLNTAIFGGRFGSLKWGGH